MPVAWMLLITSMLPYVMVIFFWGQRSHIREMMKERMEHEQTVTLRIEAGGFQWVKEGKEILVQGRMFDVKKVKESNGTFTFSGLFDDDEKQIVQNWLNYFHKTAASKHFSQIIDVFFSIGQSFQPAQLSVFCSDVCQKNNWHDNYFSQYSNGFTSTLELPPAVT